MKLNQVIAIEQGIKTKAEKTINESYHQAQKPALFEGLVRNYFPLTEDGEKFPSEKKLLQLSANSLIETVSKDVADWFNITVAKDIGNCSAKANIVVDGTTIATDVPVTTIIFIEKKLIELKGFVEELPVLDAGEEWAWDGPNQQFKSAIITTAKTKKVQRPITLIAPTVEHPGQAQLITEDQIVGNWQQVKLSSALQRNVKEGLLENIEKLSKAAKLAREEANNQEVVIGNIGNKVMDFLFGL